MERAVLERLCREELIELVLRLDRRCAELERQNAELAARCACLEKRCTELEKQNAELSGELAKARKNSSNSSKPPSSDIVKPPKPNGPNGKPGRIGGQPGHPKHTRPPFPPEKVDAVLTHKLDRCPNCGGRVRRSNKPPRVVQQAELVENPVVISEHRALAYVCKKCGKVHYAELPPDVKWGGLFGPRLVAFVAYLKGGCHASYSTVQAVLEWVLGVPVSRGFLAKEVDKVSGALDGPYDELLRQVRAETRLNVDETGHKSKGRLEFTWCFRAELFALFKIAPSRGSDVLVKVLGEEFNGILGCDYFSAYRKYMADFNVLVQFCLAHLIRDVKFLLTVPDKATRNYGERVLAGLRNLFHVIHRREKMSEAKFRAALERARRDLVATAKRVPMGADAHNIAERFRQHGESYFRFITTPGIEPTNNLAEQAVRFVVIDRRVTQGTRGDAGRRWCERIWTVLATCAIRHRSAFQYIHRVIRARLGSQRFPSLLLDSP
jgi:transposase